MSIVAEMRKILVAAGLTSIVLSFALDGQFATDIQAPVPAPPSVVLLAAGGVVAIAAALIRRRKK